MKVQRPVLSGRHVRKTSRILISALLAARTLELRSATLEIRVLKEKHLHISYKLIYLNKRLNIEETITDPTPPRLHF